MKEPPEGRGFGSRGQGSGNGRERIGDSEKGGITTHNNGLGNGKQGFLLPGRWSLTGGGGLGGGLTIGLARARGSGEGFGFVTHSFVFRFVI